MLYIPIALVAPDIEIPRSLAIQLDVDDEEEELASKSETWNDLGLSEFLTQPLSVNQLNLGSNSTGTQFQTDPQQQQQQHT